MLFTMTYALLIFYLKIVHCHDVVSTDPWNYYKTISRTGWCRNKDKKGCINPGYLFGWNDVPGDETYRLLSIIEDCPDIGSWVNKAEIYKTDDGKTIIISKDEKLVNITIDEEKEKATIKNSNGGTYDLKIKRDEGELNIYYA